MAHTASRFNDISPSRLENLYNRLSVIPEGRDVVKFLKDHNINIFFQQQGVAFASGNVTVSDIKKGNYIYGPCSISLNEKLSDDNLLQALIHESQHLRHHFAGLGNPQSWIDNNDHCLLRRIQEADAQAITTFITYKLMKLGDCGPYNELKQTSYSFMCNAFESTCDASIKNLSNGAALRSAFDAWFTNNTITKFYDRDTILNQIPFLKARLWDFPSHGIAKGTLKESWISRIGDFISPNYLTIEGYPSLVSDSYRINIKNNLSLFPIEPTGPTVN